MEKKCYKRTSNNEDAGVEPRVEPHDGRSNTGMIDYSKVEVLSDIES